MLSLKSEGSEDSGSLITTADSSQELNRWKNLVFKFEMDRGNNSNTPNRDMRRSRSASTSRNTPVTSNPPHLDADAAISAQLAALAALAGHLDDQNSGTVPPQTTYPSVGPSPGFYNNFLHHNPWPQGSQQPPVPPTNYPWAAPPDPRHFPNIQTGPSIYNLPQGPGSSSNPFMGMPFPFQTSPQEGLGMGARHDQSPPTPVTPTPSTPNSSEVDQSLLEEKRRRNTEASARFRIKKKHKTITLERSVSDLKGRAEELEREVADLRRENGWLKEIVMLKGAQFAANRTQPHSNPEASSSRGITNEAERSEPDSDTEEQPVRKDKGKAPDRVDKRKD